MRENNAAIQIQRLVRGVLARRWCQTQLQKVIFLQSCIRRRVARKQLLLLKADAKSADHFKEVSYKLENKVVELTQSVTSLKTEKKEISVKVSHLERQIQHWADKHKKMEKEAKIMEIKLRESSVLMSEFDALLMEKEKINSEHTGAMEKITSLTAEMETIRSQLKAEKLKNEALSKVEVPNNNEEITELKSQIVALKAQLVKSMHTRQQQSSLPPINNKSRTMSPSGNPRRNTPRLGDDNPILEKEDDIKPLRQTSVLTHRKVRRNSSAEVTGNIPRSSIDQIRKAELLNNGKNPRPTSVGQSNTIAGGKSSVLDEISDDPEEEVCVDRIFFFPLC